MDTHRHFHTPVYLCICQKRNVFRWLRVKLIHHISVGEVRWDEFQPTTGRITNFSWGGRGRRKTGKAEVCNKVVLGCKVSTAGSLNSASMRKKHKTSRNTYKKLSKICSYMQEYLGKMLFNKKLTDETIDCFVKEQHSWSNSCAILIGE